MIAVVFSFVFDVSSRCLSQVFVCGLQKEGICEDVVCSEETKTPVTPVTPVVIWGKKKLTISSILRSNG